MFGKQSKEVELENMARYLEDNGYLVKKVNSKTYKDFTNEAVLAVFYESLEKHYGIHYATSAKDKKAHTTNVSYLKKFQSRLIRRGYSVKYANLVVYQIITKIFNTKDVLKYRTIRKLEDVLGSEALGMINKAFKSKNNKELPDHLKDRFESLCYKMYNHKDDVYEDIVKKRQEGLIKRYGKENNKEES